MPLLSKLNRKATSQLNVSPKHTTIWLNKIRRAKHCQSAELNTIDSKLDDSLNVLNVSSPSNVTPFLTNSTSKLLQVTGKNLTDDKSGGIFKKKPLRQQSAVPNLRLKELTVTPAKFPPQAKSYSVRAR